MKQIQIRIYPNGDVKAETRGIKGKACLDYIPTIEKLTNAVTRDSDYTADYWDGGVMLEMPNEQEVQT